MVAQTPEGALPPMHVPNDGPPQSRLWPAKNPGPLPGWRRCGCAADDRGTRATDGEPSYPGSPTPSGLASAVPVTEESVDRALADLGARPWQRELTVTAITRAGSALTFLIKAPSTSPIAQPPRR